MSESDVLIHIPTFIPSIDKIIGGGMPVGTTMLIIAEPGSGGQEFIFTSIANYCRELASYTPSSEGDIRQPDFVYYVTQKASKETFLKMMKHQFTYLDSIDFERVLLDKRVMFLDIGDIFFARSIVPHTWYSKKSITEHLMHMPPSDEYGGLTYLAGLVDKVPEYSTVYMDCLTPYLSYFSDPDKWRNLVSLLYGISRAAQSRHLTFVFLLTANILTQTKEIEIGNAFGAILHLNWQKSPTAMTRQRQMYIGKFAGVLSILAPRDIAIYNVSISLDTGFEISNLRRVT
jgi:hypothetical protein